MYSTLIVASTILYFSVSRAYIDVLYIINTMDIHNDATIAFHVYQSRTRYQASSKVARRVRCTEWALRYSAQLRASADVTR